MRNGLTLSIAAVVAAGALAACGGETAGPTPAPPAPAADAPAEDAVPFELTFIDGMVPHHEQALVMAQSALDAGLAVPELVSIANAILATQQAEIDQMRAWREEWYGSADVDPANVMALGLSLAEMGMEHDLGAMAAAEDVDAAFAAAMVEHHEGAIRMAELALERAERPELLELAERIVEAQRAEIETMSQHAGMHHG